MEYFVYLSDAKIEMLFEQIQPKSRGKLVGEIEFNLALFRAKFNTASIEETRYEKIHVIENHLRRTIGTIDSPGKYFAGTLDMAWGPYEGYEEMVYFSCATPEVVVGLGGSMYNCIPNPLARPTTTTSFSLSSRLVAALVRRKEIHLSWGGLGRHFSNADVNSDALSAIVQSAIRYGLPHQRLKFLAKTVLSGYDEHTGKSALLGTPIYVALAE